jgi:hypothetical protein
MALAEAVVLVVLQVPVVTMQAAVELHHPSTSRLKALETAKPLTHHYCDCFTTGWDWRHRVRAASCQSCSQATRLVAVGSAGAAPRIPFVISS